MQIHNAVITGSFSYNGADLSNVTSSNQYSASLSTRVTQIEQVYATTGSNSFRATQSITGSLTVTGQIVAQTLNVQQVTSSIVYSSGSNVFGCDINSRQTFTGSVYITGSSTQFTNNYIGINCSALVGRTVVIKASVDGCSYPLEVIDCAGVNSIYLAPNSGGNLNLISGNYLSGGTYKSLAISARENACDFILSNTGVATFACGITTRGLFITTLNGQVGDINSTDANGGYLTWSTNGTIIADIGTAQQIFGAGGTSVFGINARGAKDIAVGTNNTERMRISSTGTACFACQVCTTQLGIRSALPRIELSSTNYAGLYKSFFGSLNTAEGILQLGNNGANYILIGNTSAGGYLQFRTNINADYGYGCGLEALTIYCDTSVCFAGPVKLAGAYASCLGLGTTSSPAKYLHIQGTNNFTQGIRFSEAGGAYPHNIYFGSPDSSAACWGLDFQVATGAVTSTTVLSLRGNCVACFAGQICAYSFTATANPVAVEYLIVAGGGGGGWDVGGGGGAGGTLMGSTGLLPGTYPVGIGAGGAGSVCNAATGITSACRGYSTYAMGLIAIGGGGGGNYAGGNGGNGASSGGGAGYGSVTFGGVPMVGSGCKGGDSISAYGSGATGGGGGGATGQGCPSVNAIGSCTSGGAGVLTTIIGASCSFACGGRGGGDSWAGAQAGPANSGYGGDGAGAPNAGSNGGSGIFVIKALNTNTISFSGGLTVTTCTNVGGYNIYAVTAGAGTMTIS